MCNDIAGVKREKREKKKKKKKKKAEGRLRQILPCTHLTFSGCTLIQIAWDTDRTKVKERKKERKRNF